MERFFGHEVSPIYVTKLVFVQLGSAAELPYEEGTFDLVTAVETVYFWPNLPGCVKGIHRVLKSGGHFAIMVEVVDTDSKWTNVVEGMTAYTPEQLKALLDDAGFAQTEIHRKKPMYATISRPFSRRFVNFSRGMELIYEIFAIFAPYYLT